MVHHV
jgi:hypothetical protein